MSSSSTTWFNFWSNTTTTDNTNDKTTTNETASTDQSVKVPNQASVSKSSGKIPNQIAVIKSNSPKIKALSNASPIKKKPATLSKSDNLGHRASTTSLASMTSGNWLSWKKEPTTSSNFKDDQDIDEDDERRDENDEEIETNDEDIVPDDNGDEVDDHVRGDSNTKKGINWFWNGTNNSKTNSNTASNSNSNIGNENNDESNQSQTQNSTQNPPQNQSQSQSKSKESKILNATNTILNSTPSIPTKEELSNFAKKVPDEVQRDDAVLYKPHDKAAQFNQINTHKNENLRENIIVPDWNTCLPTANEGLHVFQSSSTSNQNNSNQIIRTDLKNWRQFLNLISSKFGFSAGPLSDSDTSSQSDNDKAEEDFGLLYEKSYKLYGKSLAILPEDKRACLPNYNKYYRDVDSPVRNELPSQYEEDQNDPNSISITNDAMGNLLINSSNNKRKTLHQSFNTEIVNYKSGPLKRIKNVLIIGVHGFFPTRMIRPLIGAPKGTSLKFANEAEKAVIRYCVENNLINKDQSDVSIQKIALEKEGKIFDRVHFFTEILQKWETELNNADFIFIASHSQGCVVSIILLARLIRMGILKDPIHKRISILGMAGINNGPFYGVDKSFFMKAYSAIEHDSLNELFELTKFDSPQSVVYKESIRTIINVNVKICFIGSINDQLVPLYSALASHIFHPNIYRACYIDYTSATPTFIEKLVSLCSQLLNLGFFDNNVIKELSTSLAGPLTGGGHSKIYNDGKVYDLGIKFALDTDDLVIPHDGKIDYDDFDNSELPISNQVYIKEYNVGKIGTNPFVLPWCLRGFLFNVEKNWPTKNYHNNKRNEGGLTNGFTEIHELYEIFDNWKPDTKIYKELKFRLNGFRASKL
ncbi:uncharacterized protein KGF55_005522 [Candida pseudojiufengensis]|uniref:uncharacterized protein n=1 Tax=Candida pseudojiufengensis TaxID=497109 RepID=UPI002224ED21|nr:uncharacterized protein KGF55_005522 [Candida pseudojiufengensis]KAI5959179.1 hypothetical protein KGF55_005522 [Candida pseudojiufengensis]